jgi:hypothetical protein
MALLGFQDRFVDKVLRGEKRHTIRAFRGGAPIKRGDWLHLYAKPRQKGMRLIFRAPCTDIQHVTIGLGGDVRVGRTELDPSERELLAQRDGFDNYHDFFKFWDGRLPFAGQIIFWSYDDRTMGNP